MGLISSEAMGGVVAVDGDGDWVTGMGSQGVLSLKRRFGRADKPRNGKASESECARVRATSEWLQAL